MEKVPVRNFKELNIWKKGIEIVKDTYLITKKLPVEERYGLVSQMRRAAVSIPSNIAEGFKRFHSKELKQFLSITSGSCAELETQLICSHELQMVSRESIKDVLDKLDHLSRMITLFTRKLN